MNELPILENLKIRRPDLYQQQWKCPLCDSFNETFEHFLISCYATFPQIKRLRIWTMDLFISKLIDLNTKGPPINTNILIDQDCWKYFSITAPKLSFIHLFRGFVPTSLDSCIPPSIKKETFYKALFDTIIQS